ncbi:ABC transporter ATP-binding protein [Halobacterium litoreum]|uniref:Cobalamin import ATP-binding protein BtuD n=1 Tax=Halobacterium litoreum TaxID=2039234 RepID=A0ABD5NFY3_9EURY|nr:ABC transporter ATP-binding protein [Halobacterium litoreum]UHH13088.1 ABC transporter ATP-binding protein [Halobacterium litoreum]
MPQTPRTPDETPEETRAVVDEDPVADAALFGTDIELGYGDGAVVDCEDIVVPEGEVTALVGPNGSGKSTLLKGFSAELEPDPGTVLLDGEDVHERPPKELARDLGLLSQENDAPGGLSVEQLISHGRYPHRGFLDPMGEDDEAAVERAIDLAGIDHLRDAALSELSGGQKQLAFVAMTLAQDTDVLLLDEPTTYLDLHHQLRVMEVVRTLNEERDVTVCVVLHDLQQAARFADYLVALDDGSVYDWGPPEDVVTEDLLADVFGVDAAVSYDDEPRIVPRRALD